MRRVECGNEKCPVRPATIWRLTEDWKPGKGHFPVNHDAQAALEWNRRG